MSLPYSHIKRSQDSPFWGGLKAFGSQFAEPFRGAAHYWTGGRLGSDYSDDSPWIDTTNRLYNALPGPNQVPLRHNDRMLDAAAGSLGVSSAAAATAAAALGAPYASSFLRAPSLAARYAVPNAARAGQVFKAVAKPFIAATTPPVLAEAATKIVPAVKRMNAYEDNVRKAFIAAGYSAEDAERMSGKMGWGGLMHVGKEYLSHPYDYIYRQGWNNPIDSAFSRTMSGYGALPHDAFSGFRQGVNVLAAGPVSAAAKAVGFGAINQLSSIPEFMKDRIGSIMARSSNAMGRLPQINMDDVENAQDAMRQSRFYKAMRDYYGSDQEAIASMYAEGLPNT